MADALVFTADVANLIEGVNKSSGAIGGLNKSLESITSATVKYNQQGQVISGVVRQQVDAFTELVSKLNITIDKTNDGVEVTKAYTHSLEQLQTASKSTVTTTGQLDAATKSLLGQFQKLDPSVTGVSIKTARFDADNKLLRGTVESLGASSGKLTAQFDAQSGAVVLLATNYRKLNEEADKFKTTTGGGGAFPRPQAPIPFSQQGKGGGGAFPTSTAPATGIAVNAAQTPAAVQSLVGAFQKLDPAITAVNLRTADYTQKGNLLNGTVTAQSATLGKLSTNFTTANGAIQAGTVAVTANKIKIDEAEKLTNSFGNAITRLSGTFQRFVEYKVFNTIADGLKEGIDAAKALQIQVSLIRTITQDNQQSQSKYISDIRGVSSSSGFNLKDVGKAFYDTASNQIAKGADIAPFVSQAANLARVTGSQLPDAVNILSSAINAYGLSTADAEKLSAQLFKTVDEGRVVLADIASTFGRVAVVAHNLSIPVEEVEAIIAITTQKGFKAADSLTLLANAMTQLEKPSEKLKGYLENVLGVNTGEAAVAKFGDAASLFKNLVNAVKEGQLSASDVSSDIRGRKQFGVFEQSIDAVIALKGKLSDTKAIIDEYNKATGIRGESPADKLVKESEKLKNAFTVDVGQSIVKTTANILDFVGGTDAITGSVAALQPIMTNATLVLGAYGIAAAGVALRNSALASSFTGVAASVGAFAFLGVGSYKVFDYLLSAKQDQFKIDPSKLNSTFDEIQKLKKEATQPVEGQKDPFAELNAQGKRVADTYKELIGLNAQANITNNKFLETLKGKGKDASDNLKLSFSALTTGINEGISKISAGISKAQTLLENSKKSFLNFQEHSQEAAFNFKLQFAQGADSGFASDQKLNLLESRKQELIDKSNKLYDQGTEESVQEARRVNNEITQTLVAIANERAALQRLGFEQGLQSGLIPQSQYGPNVFVPDITKFNADRVANEKRVQDQEKQVRRNAQDDINVGTSNKEGLQARLAAIKQAAKELEDISPFKGGVVDKAFTDENQNFSKKKFLDAFDKAQTKVTDLTPDKEEKKKIEEQLLAFRLNAIQQANALELQTFLRTNETKIAKDKEASEERIKNIKNEISAGVNLQKQIGDSLKDKPDVLRGFLNNITNAGRSTEVAASEAADKATTFGKFPAAKQAGTFKGQVGTISKDIQDLQTLIATANDPKNQIKVGDNSILNPKLLDEIDQKYADIAAKLLKVQQYAGRNAALVQTVDGKPLTLGDTTNAVRSQVDKAKAAGAQVDEGVQRTQTEKGAIDQFIVGPVAELKKQFPDLATAADDAFKKLNESAKQNDGLEQLKTRLIELQKIAGGIVLPGQGVPVGPVIGGDEDVPGFATGGIVGLFPGKPRGVDQYPIWAAKGERIFSAETSRLYRPLMDAIQARTAPRYMAAGGIVGDQTVGDVTNNITVNGGATNSETGRVIGNTIERLLRRKQTRLN